MNGGRGHMRVGHGSTARLQRSYGHLLGNFALRVALMAFTSAACTARPSVEGEPADGAATGSNDGASPAQAPPASGKKGLRRGLKGNGLQLLYRQASEQARQRLTVENAHLRLDELDAQIEREQETKP